MPDFYKSRAIELVFLSGLMPLLAPPAAAGQEPPDTNYDESLVAVYELPDPLVCFDGGKVADAKAWREIRRPEIVAAFAEHVFGKTPTIATHLRSEPLAPDAEVFGDKATRKQVRLRFFDAEDAPWIDMLVYVPRGTSSRPPVFLGLNYGNQGVEADDAIVPFRNSVCRPGGDTGSLGKPAHDGGPGVLTTLRGPRLPRET